MPGWRHMSNKNQAITEAELLQRIARGDDSRLQFKRTVMHPDALATEVRRLNQVRSNAASQPPRSPISPLTENVLTNQGGYRRAGAQWFVQTLLRSSGAHTGQAEAGQAPGDSARRTAAHVPERGPDMCRPRAHGRHH